MKTEIFYIYLPLYQYHVVHFTLPRLHDHEVEVTTDRDEESLARKSHQSAIRIGFRQSLIRLSMTIAQRGVDDSRTHPNSYDSTRLIFISFQASR